MSPFHQGAYFASSAAETAGVWALLAEHSIAAVGVSLLNPLHSQAPPPTLCQHFGMRERRESVLDPNTVFQTPREAELLPQTFFFQTVSEAPFTSPASE